jgi:nitrate/TMAO reductase-like tetraheme cytochrome c subunit
VDEKFQMEHEEDGSENWKLQRKKRLFLFKLLVIKVVFLLCKIFKFGVEEYKKNQQKKETVCSNQKDVYVQLHETISTSSSASISER